MNRVDDVLTRAADEVRSTVDRMPTREVRTVEARNTRRNALAGVAVAAVVVIVALLGWNLWTDRSAPPIDEIRQVDPDAEALPGALSPLEPGSYVSDAMAAPFSFEVDELDGGRLWLVQTVAAGEVVISHPDSVGPGDSDLIFMFPEALSDPDDLRSPTWPVDDIDGWLESIDPAWIVEQPTPLTIGGRDALHVSLRVALGGGCDPLGPGEDFEPGGPPICDTLAFGADNASMFFADDLTEYDVWWIRDVGGRPFLAASGFVGTIIPDRDAWEASVLGVVESLAVADAGEIQAAPEAAVFAWEEPGILINGDQIRIEGDAPTGFPARAYVGGRLDDTETTDFGADLFQWDTSVDPPIPLPVAEIDAIAAGTDGAAVCAALDGYSQSLAPQDMDGVGSFVRAEAFVQYAIQVALGEGCRVAERTPDGVPPAITPGAVGDAAVLQERARTTDPPPPRSEALVGDAITQGLLDFSGDLRIVGADLVRFAWLLDTTNPDPRLLDLFVDPSGPAWATYAGADTFRSGALLVPTDGAQHSARVLTVSSADGLLPVVAASTPDGAYVVDVEATIPEIDVVAPDGSVIRTVPARAGVTLRYVLVPSETGWRIWSESEA